MGKGILREMFSGANQRLSSKRITGAFCVISSTCVILFLAVTDPTFPSINSLLEWVLITGAGLLGLGLAERRFSSTTDKKVDSDNSEHTTDEEEQ